MAADVRVQVTIASVQVDGVPVGEGAIIELPAGEAAALAKQGAVKKLAKEPKRKS